MENFRLKEAVEYAKQNQRVRKKELAQTMWKNSRPKTAATNFTNLITGKTKMIEIDFIPFLCKELGVTADFLFGLESEPTRERSDIVKRKEVIDSIELMQDTLADLKEHIKNL